MRRQSLTVLSATLLTLTVTSAAWPQSNTLDTAAIIKAVEHYPQQLQAVRMKGVETERRTADFYRLMPDPGQPHSSPAKRSVEWAFKDQKRFKQYTESFKLDNQTAQHKLTSRTRSEIFDGQNQYNLLDSKYTGRKDRVVQGVIEHSDGTEILPLRFGHQVDGQWLVDALRSGRYHENGTTTDPQFGLLYQFTGSSNTNAQTRFWLAPKYGFIAVRIEDDFEAPSHHQQLAFLTRRVEQHNSVWFPTAGTMQFSEVAGDRKTLLTERQFTVHQLELNTVPDSFFKPNLQPGYFMKDGTTNEYWKITPNGGKLFIDISNQDQISKRPMGWLFMLSLTSLLFLGMGAIWRRRGTASVRS